MSACADEAWDRFVDASTTLGPTPGVREAWRQGRVRYTVWLLRVPQVAERVAEVAWAVAPWVHAVEPADAHVTLWAAGFPVAHGQRPDDVEPADLEVQSRALRERGGPVTLRIGGASAFRSAVFLAVDGGGQLRDILAAVSASEPRTVPWCPHVTVGVFDGDHPVGPVRAALAAWRELPEITVVVDQVERVDFDARVPGARLRTRDLVGWHG